MADFNKGQIKLQQEENDKYAWIDLTEAKNYELIDGIYDELDMADNMRKGIKSEWERSDDLLK